MKRRKAIQGIILFSLGTGYLFSCKDKYQAIKDLGLKYFNPLRNELDLLENLSSIILPLHTIPQFENHTPLPFIFKMLDEVYSPKERALFQEVFQDFDVITGETAGRQFSAMDKDQQLAFLTSLNSSENSYDASLNTFFRILKDLNIKYLRTSEFFERKINYYEMEPGRFLGNVLVADLTNQNQI